MNGQDVLPTDRMSVSPISANSIDALVGVRVKQRRVELGMSQEDLARESSAQHGRKSGSTKPPTTTFPAAGSASCRAR